MRFQNQTALITAAGAGIGRATAEIMAREGAYVFAVDIDEGRLASLGQAMADAPGRIEGRAIDGTDEAAVKELVAEIEAGERGVDVLVNAVGGSTIIDQPAATVDELSYANWQALIDFNLSSTFLFTNAATPAMKRAGRGKIVNLSSIAGRGLSGASSSAYAAAKGGVIAFTRKISSELGPYGINVNAIAPSLTLTERIRPHWEKRSADQQATEVERVPLRRVAEAADQARVIAFLASSDADFITGVTIDVSGGLA